MDQQLSQYRKKNPTEILVWILQVLYVSSMEFEFLWKVLFHKEYKLDFKQGLHNRTINNKTDKLLIFLTFLTMILTR